MGSCNGGGQVNSFALVSYIPQPLAGFVDRLRAELVQECHARAHVTVLPPRPLPCDTEEAWRSLQSQVQDFQPFLVELGPVEIFPVTQVIYISVLSGHAELKRLHAMLNTGQLTFEEPFVYHPHVTLAQDIEPSRVAAMLETAATRWNEYGGSHSFVVDRLTFVQNTIENRWTDLRGCALTSDAAIGPPA